MTEPQTEDPMVAALLREREGYVQRGMDDHLGSGPAARRSLTSPGRRQGSP